MTSIRLRSSSMCQDFSHRTYSSTRVVRSSDAPASAITLTSALPTTAASAHWPTSRTCSGFEMPNPRAIGRALTARIRPTISCAPSAIVVARAGHAKPRNRIQKAAAEGRGLAQSFIGRRRAEQENCINPARRQQAAEAVGLLDRQVEHEHAVHPGLPRPVGEALGAEPQDRIGVAEDDDRRAQILPQAPDQVEHAGQRRARGQRALRRPLDDRAVGQRIRKRHADLQDVGAGAIERAQDALRCAADPDRRR